MVAVDRMSYASIFKRICRICLHHCSPKTSMTQLYGSELNDYAKAVLVFADITITPTDGLPNQICHKCLTLLRKAIAFKLTCERTHKYLENLMKNNFTANNLKMHIVQYSMFSNYFPEDHNNEKEQNVDNFKVADDVNDLFDDTASDLVKHTEESADAEWFYRKMSDYLKTTRKPKEPSEKSAKKRRTLKIEKLKEMVKKKYTEKRQSKRFQEALLGTKFESAPERRKEVPESLVCVACDRKYANRASLRAHMQRHDGFHFICEHCGKGFKTRAELNSHCMALHDMPRSYACSQCSFKAVRKPDLTHHMLEHTGERPYACETCGLTFRRKAVLRKHMVHHLEKKFKCEQCSRTFYHRTDLAAHNNNVHERRYLYRCYVPSCQTTYAKTASVRKHLRNVHGIQREQQGKILRISVHSAPTHIA